MELEATIVGKYSTVASVLDERSRRRWAAAESAAIGYGGDALVSLPPSSAPTATGWSDSCRAGFAPAEEWRLSRRTRSLSLAVWITTIDAR